MSNLQNKHTVRQLHTWWGNKLLHNSGKTKKRIYYENLEYHWFTHKYKVGGNLHVNLQFTLNFREASIATCNYGILQLNKDFTVVMKCVSRLHPFEMMNIATAVVTASKNSFALVYYKIFNKKDDSFRNYINYNVLNPLKNQIQNKLNDTTI